MKQLHLILFVLFPLLGCTQDKIDDYEILKITNFAGLTGKKNAIEISFPDKLDLSKIVYSYAYKKYPNDIKSDTLLFNGISFVQKKLKYKEKRTASVLSVKQYDPETLRFYVESLDKKNRKARFDWGDLKQPKRLYPSKKQHKKKKHKKRYNKWLLKEVTIYSKKIPTWFDEKDAAALNPTLRIENLLFGFAQKGKKNTVGDNKGVAPRLLISNLAKVQAVKVFQPSSADVENCNLLGYRWNDRDYTFNDDRLLPIKINNGDFEIEFYNKRGTYEQAHLSCKPKIEFLFQVANKKLPPPDLETSKNGFAMRDTVEIIQEHAVSSEVTPCKYGVYSCGQIVFSYSPEIRQTTLYCNEKYKITRHNDLKDIIYTLAEKAIVDTIIVDTFTLVSVQLKYNNGRYKEVDFKRGTNGITLPNLDSGEYDVKLFWEMKSIEIDTTIYFSSKKDAMKCFQSIRKENYKPKIRVDSFYFKIEEGGGRPNLFNIDFAQGLSEKCLTMAEMDQDRNKDCSKDKITISARDRGRYLAISLNRDELTKLDPSNVVSADFKGNPADFQSNGGKVKFINCEACKEHKKNKIYWGAKKQNIVQGILVFDLEKMGNSLRLTAITLENDGPITIYYQFMSIKQKTK